MSWRRRGRWRAFSSARSGLRHLDTFDLAERYGLGADQVASIRVEAVRDLGERQGVFASLGGGFTAWLHYSIFTCRAE